MSSGLARALRAAGASLVARVLGVLVDRVPREVALGVAERMHSPAPMDYERAEIVLRQSSRMTGKRLGSAAKEPFTVEWIERSFHPGDVFYDVGANVGAYALIAAKSSGSEVRTFAFEPSAPSYHDLCLNVALNGCSDAITPLPFALWSETSLIPFAHYSLDPGSSKHTFSFDEAREARALLFRQRQAALSLDDAVRLLGLPPPTHMKIDTEGSELRVLAGATETLRSPGWQSILTEIGANETAAPFEGLLGPHGFRLTATYRRRPKSGVSYNLYVRERTRRPYVPRRGARGGGAARRGERGEAPARLRRRSVRGWTSTRGARRGPGHLRRRAASSLRARGGAIARATEFAAWIALAASVAVVAAFDAITEAIQDHNNFGDVDHVIEAAAWLTLAGWAAARGFSTLPSPYARIRRWFVIALLLAACPYPAIVQDDSGYAVNAFLLAVALLMPVVQFGTGVVHRRRRASSRG